ncbi:MAG: Bacterial regulatory protein ArsR [Verrucomicrobiota bacterium]|jgi:ArsR family transcriptional regulator
MNKLAEQVKEEFQGNELVCAKVITLFQLIANKTRFRIICLLARGEFCVNDIVEVVDAGKLSNISQQLKILCLAGLIERRRQQKRILYSLKDERIRDMIDYFRAQFLSPKCN